MATLVISWRPFLICTIIMSNEGFLLHSTVPKTYDLVKKIQSLSQILS